MTLSPYPNYKDSGVEWLGDVPSHWSPTRLRFQSTLNPSKAEISDLDPKTEVSFVPMEAVGESGELTLDQTRPISEVLTGYTYFREGDVSIAKITPCFENGKGAIMRSLSGGVGFGTTELIVARPRPRATTPEFLNWLFRSHAFRDRGEAAMYGAGGQKRVPDNFVRDFVSAGAPLNEQIAIAAFLDRETAKIDALIEEQQRLIALLDEKRQAVISHAVTKGLNPNAPMKHSGIAWLGEVPADWAVAGLGYRYEVKLGKMLDEKRISGAHLRPYLRNVDVQWWQINAADLPLMDFHPDEIERFSVQNGDVLVCEGGEVGRAAIWRGKSGDVCYQKALHRLRCLRSGTDDPEYLCFVFEALAGGDVFAGSEGRATIAHLTAEKLRKYRFPFPPSEEQIRIAQFLNGRCRELSVLRQKSEEAIKLLKERRSGLISAAVTGKIDVRGLIEEQVEAA